MITVIVGKPRTLCGVCGREGGVDCEDLVRFDVCAWETPEVFYLCGRCLLAAILKLEAAQRREGR